MTHSHVSFFPDLPAAPPGLFQVVFFNPFENVFTHFVIADGSPGFSATCLRLDSMTFPRCGWLNSTLQEQQKSRGYRHRNAQ